MKKIISILTLVVGVGIGWGISTYQTQRSFEKRYQESWDPKFQDFVKEIGSIGAVLEKTVTADEIQEFMKTSVEYGSKVVTDYNAQTFGKAFQSFLIAKLLKDGQIDEAIESSESCLARFVKKYDKGHFENDINEELAGKLAEAIKSANKSSEPILKTPSP